MAATNWSDIIDTALEVIPLGSYIKAAKSPFMMSAKTAIKSNKYYRQLITNPAVKHALRNRWGEKVVEGFKRGMIGGPLAGAVNAPIHVFLSPAEEYAGNLLRQQVSNKLFQTTKALGMAPE